MIGSQRIGGGDARKATGGPSATNSPKTPKTTKEHANTSPEPAALKLTISAPSIYSPPSSPLSASASSINVAAAATSPLASPLSSPSVPNVAAAFASGGGASASMSNLFSSYKTMKTGGTLIRPSLSQLSISEAKRAGLESSAISPRPLSEAKEGSKALRRAEKHKVPLTTDEIGNRRVFKALHGYEYLGPSPVDLTADAAATADPLASPGNRTSLSKAGDASAAEKETAKETAKETPKENGKEAAKPKEKAQLLRPLYMGSNGKVYNRKYQLIEEDLYHLETSQTTAKNLPYLANPLFQNMPKPEDFTHFLDYEQAVHNWKTSAEEALGDLRLPDVMGRYYCRPRVTAVVDQPDTNGQFNEDGDNMEGTGTLTASASQLISIPLRRPLSASESASNQFMTPDGNPTADERTAAIGGNAANSLKSLQTSDPDGGINPTDLDYDITNQSLDHDPWEACLVPEEPNPADYDTFEEYEEAMVQWSITVAEQLPVIPPHASQLASLIPIQSVPDKVINPTAIKKVGELIEIQAQDEEKSYQIPKTGLIVVPFFENRVPDRGRIKVHFPSTIEGMSNEGRNLKPEQKEKISKLFQASIEKKQNYAKKWSWYMPPVGPKIHGVLPRSYPMGTANSQAAQPLRRTDLTEEELSSCHDCPSTLHGKKLAFTIPEVDVPSLDWTKIVKDPAYVATIKKTIAQISCSERLNHLNSWWHPEVPQSVHDRHHKQLTELLTSSDPPIKAQHFDEVFRSGMYLDQFQEFLSEGLPHADEDDSGLSRTFLAVMNSGLSYETMKQILCNFETTNSQLVHAKVAAFIAESLQAGFGKSFLKDFAQFQDIKSLSYVAYALCFFAEVPIDVFPYQEETIALLQRVLGSKQTDSFVKLIFTNYYITIIEKAIRKYQFAYIGINSFLADTHMSSYQNIDKILTKEPEILQRLLCKGAAHHSSSLANLCFFLLVQMMNITDQPLVQKHLRSPQLGMVEHVRKTLARSKFNHVQYIAKRLFSILQSPEWVGFLFAHYSAKPVILIKEDLSAPPRNDNYPSLITILVMEMIQKVLESADLNTVNQITFLLEEKIFKDFLQEVLSLDDIKKKKVDGEIIFMETYSNILAWLSKAFARLNLLYLTPDAGARHIAHVKNRGNSNLGLNISPKELAEILNFVEMKKIGNFDTTSLYKIRSNMLVVLTNLLKNSDIFEIVKNDIPFYQKALHCCKDGGHVEYNRRAFRLWFTVVRSHAGIIDFLMKNQLLNRFLEISQASGTGGGNAVITNGLRYLSRIFSLVESESKRSEKGKALSRGEIKTVEKDVSALCKFFKARTLFINIHMIYMRFSNPPTFPGSLFTELANFYMTLMNTPQCANLLKDIKRHADYKAGVGRISSMFTPPITYHQPASTSIGRSAGKVSKKNLTSSQKQT